MNEQEVVLLESFCGDLGLEIVFAGRGRITLTSYSVSRPGLQFAGFFNYFDSSRILVFGNLGNELNGIFHTLGHHLLGYVDGFQLVHSLYFGRLQFRKVGYGIHSLLARQVNLPLEQNQRQHGNKHKHYQNYHQGTCKHCASVAPKDVCAVFFVPVFENQITPILG